MKIGCNYYLETEELVRDKQIEIDYFKFPALGFQMGIMEDEIAFTSFCKRVTALKPILLHGLYPAPHDLSFSTLKDNFNYKLCDQLIQATKTPGISFHPCFRPIDQNVNITSLLDTIINNISFIKHTYSDLDFVSVENVDSLRFGQLIDPDVFSTIINESGCDFLLDISHAYCSARARGENVREYIKRLPLKQVYEIHVNGWLMNENGIMCHVKTHKECYDLLEEVLEVANPKIITIEYGRGDDKIGAGIPTINPNSINPEVKYEIMEQIDHIRRIVNGRV